MILLQFLGNLLRYKVSIEYFRPGIIRDIKENLNNGGAVWIKFAQTLAQLDGILDPELVIALEPLWAECAIHPHELSRDVISRDFGVVNC